MGCSTPLLLFLAIESPPQDLHARDLARSTWLQWQQQTASVDYRFFTLDTSDTRAETADHDDLIIFSERGSEFSGDIVNRGIRGKFVDQRYVGTPPNERSGNMREHRTKSGVDKPKTHPQLCKGDYRRLCKDKVAPGNGRIDACMYLNRAGLSAECFQDLAQYEVTTKGERAARDWSFPEMSEARKRDRGGVRRHLAWWPVGRTQPSLSTPLPMESGGGVGGGGGGVQRQTREGSSDRKLAWCSATSKGSCLAQPPSGQAVPPSLFKQPLPARFNNGALRPTQRYDSAPGASGTARSDGKLYSPFILGVFRYWTLEWSATNAPPYTYLLMLDLSRGTLQPGSGFLCLPSLLRELEIRPRDRFIWRHQLPCVDDLQHSKSPSLDEAKKRRSEGGSFVLLSRDVVELLRSVSRRHGSTLLLLDRLLRRLPLSSLSDHKRLSSSDDIDWGEYEASEDSNTLGPVLCDDYIWVADVAAASKRDDASKEKAQENNNNHARSMESIFLSHAGFVARDRPRRLGEAAFLRCSTDDMTIQEPSFPRDIRQGRAKYDRELVVAARLGFDLNDAEELLEYIRMIAAIAAPGDAAGTASERRNILNINSESVKRHPSSRGPSSTTQSRRKKRGEEAQLSSPSSQQYHHEERMTIREASLGHRPRLESWKSLEGRTQSVVNACSLDLLCVWDHIASEEIALWWHEADLARTACCCSNQVASAPPQCSAFKTRRYLRHDGTGAKGGALLAKRTSSPQHFERDVFKFEVGDARSYGLIDENRTYADELQYISSLKARHNRSDRSQGGDKVVPIDGQDKMCNKYRSRNVLAATKGSGNIQVRLLLEYASGFFTGSSQFDREAVSLLPAEGVTSHVLLVDVAGHFPSEYMRLLPPMPAECGPRRVVLLVRHPLVAIHAAFRRTHVGEIMKQQFGHFETIATCMVCGWVKHFLGHFELIPGTMPPSLSSLSNFASSDVHLLRYERLTDPLYFLDELASVLNFLEVGPPSPERLNCLPFLASVHSQKLNEDAIVSAMATYSALPGLSCKLWSMIEGSHPAASFLLRIVEYENIAECDHRSAETAKSCVGGGVDRRCTGLLLRTPDDEATTTSARQHPSPRPDSTEAPKKAAVTQQARGALVPREGMASAIGKGQQGVSAPREARVERCPPRSNGDGPLPLVAVVVSSTSRGVVKKGATKLMNPRQLQQRFEWVENTTRHLIPTELVLFTTMLPSLTTTLECGFRYLLVVGFDEGDLLFDRESTLVTVRTWIDLHVVAKAKYRGLAVAYKILRVRNPLKKPGPIFNVMSAYAFRTALNKISALVDAATVVAMGDTTYNDSADYVYRVNDDTEFAGPWAKRFVLALKGLGPPIFGVVGPSCAQGNLAILTHDFTSRVHAEIFGGQHYPPELVDWWMDDWISRVYGRSRTKLLKSVEVIHHSKTYGRRYDVNGSNRHLVDGLVEQGKATIMQWMHVNGASQAALHSYSTDKFDFRQEQRAIDQSTIKRKSRAVKPTE